MPENRVFFFKGIFCHLGNKNIMRQVSERVSAILFTVFPEQSFSGLVGTIGILGFDSLLWENVLCMMFDITWCTRF